MIPMGMFNWQGIRWLLVIRFCPCHNRVNPALIPVSRAHA